MKAMSVAKGVLLVLDGGGVPFERIWCDYELFKTVSNSEKLLDIAATTNGKTRLLVDGLLPGEPLVEKVTRELKFSSFLTCEGSSSETGEWKSLSGEGQAEYIEIHWH